MTRPDADLPGREAQLVPVRDRVLNQAEPLEGATVLDLGTKPSNGRCAVV